MTSAPIVDIAMVTYNHEKYVAQAIESVLAQQTNFPYRLIIGDDCSSDNTKAIIKNYAEQHPKYIKTILLNKNLGTTHPNRIGIQVLKLCTAKYIALLDGDDYWCNSHKLQKQVDFLNDHPEFSMCYHNASIHYVNENRWATFISDSRKKVYHFEDMVLHKGVPTLSIVYRREHLPDLPIWSTRVSSGDAVILYNLAVKGPAGYIDEKMGVYNVHKGGIYSSEGIIKNFEARIRTLQLCKDKFGKEKQKIFEKAIADRYFQLHQHLVREGKVFQALIPAIKTLYYARKDFSHYKPKLLGTTLKALKASFGMQSSWPRGYKTKR